MKLTTTFVSLFFLLGSVAYGAECKGTYLGSVGSCGGQDGCEALGGGCCAQFPSGKNGKTCTSKNQGCGNCFTGKAS